MRCRSLVSVLVLMLSVVSVVQAEGVSVGGRVLVVGGAALPQAEVQLLPLQDVLRMARSVAVGEATEPAARGITDDEGRFRLEAPHAGLWQVRVEAPGLMPMTADIRPLIEPIELSDVELAPDVGMTIRVIDPAGSPVRGALVVLQNDDPIYRFLASTWSGPLRSGETGEDGTLRLAHGERERVSLSVSAPGRALAELRGVSGTAATVRLAAGRPRPIEVVSAEGRPVAEVLVAGGKMKHPLGLTDESGRITIDSKRSGPTPLELLAADGRALETALAPNAPAEPDKPRRLVLPERMTLAGRLIDAESRRAVAGGLVWDMEDPDGAATTEDGGGFTLEGPPGRRMRIVSGAPGYLHSDPLEYQLSDDGRPGPTLALRPAAAIEGKVLDENGEAVIGAEVTLRKKPTPGMMSIEIGGIDHSPRNLSDSGGRFRLSPVDPDEAYIVKAQAEGFAPGERSVSGLEPYRTKKGQNLDLARGQAVSGVVVDPQGSPLRDVSVEIKPAPIRGGMGMMEMMGGESASVLFAGSSDGEGRFIVAGVPAGNFELTAKRSGFAKASLSGVEVVKAGEPVDVGQITLEPGERVQGMVRNRSGQPVEGVDVFAKEAGPMMRMMWAGPGVEGPEPDTVSDPNGWFSVEDLAPGKQYSFSFERTGYVGGNVGPVTLPHLEPLEAVLHPASLVSGYVLDGEGEPIVAASVSMRRSQTIEMGGNVMQTIMMHGTDSDAEGKFLFEDQEPGKIALSATASGYQESKLANLEIVEGQDLEGIELPLASGAVLVGKVLAPDGRAAIGARVMRVSGREDPMGMMGGNATDGEGSYRIEGLAPGTISVEARHEDYPRVVKDIEVREGTNTLELSFEGGVEVSGVVVDPAGDPVADALARLVPVGRHWGGPEARTAADGTFEMPGVQEGDYQLYVNAEGFAETGGDRRVSVVGEPVHGLEVRLDQGATLFGEISGLEPEQLGRVSVNAEGPGVGGFDDGSRVDFEGNYRVEHLKPGAYNVVASLPRTGKQAKGQVVIEEGATEARLDLEFGSGLTLTGRVVQGETALSGVTVIADGEDVDHTGWCQTDQQGAFSLEGLAPGRYRVNVRNFQTGLAHSESFDLATSREIELKVPTAVVSGRIVDSTDRAPLQGVAVILTHEEQDGRAHFPTHTAITDVEGRFTVPNIGDGRWKLAASKQGYAAVSRELTVQHEKSLEGVEISMDATEGMTLEARLPSGSAPEQVSVAVVDPNGSALVSGNFSTGENGRVRLTSVPPGTWGLVISAPGAATSNLSAQAPGATIPVLLQPACALDVSVPELADSASLATVRLADAQGKPFRSLSWNGQPQSEWRMSGGRIQFSSLPPGNWSVNVATADGRSWQGSRTTAPGSKAELLLE